MTSIETMAAINRFVFNAIICCQTITRNSFWTSSHFPMRSTIKSYFVSNLKFIDFLPKQKSDDFPNPSVFVDSFVWLTDSPLNALFRMKTRIFRYIIDKFIDKIHNKINKWIQTTQNKIINFCMFVLCLKSPTHDLLR